MMPLIWQATTTLPPCKSMVVVGVEPEWLGSSLNLDSRAYVSAYRETKANLSFLTIPRSRSGKRREFRTDFRLRALLAGHLSPEES